MFNFGGPGQSPRIKRMKTRERHHLKQNEFAATVGRLTVAAREQRDKLVLIAIVVLVVVAIAGGYTYFTKHKRDEAGAAFAAAMAVNEAQIAPAPTVPGAKQPAGTFATIKARQEASLQAFQQVASTYGSTPEGLAASYQIASLFVSLDRLADAE